MLKAALLMTAAALSTFAIDTTGEDVATRAAELRYDALNPQGKRKTPVQTIQREDVYLTGKRTKLQATSADIVRNFSVAAWAVRRHLDYVAKFEFQACNADKGLNRDLETLMEIQSRPLNMDRGGRFGREKMFRCAEARRVIDNETYLMLLNSGHIQGIESDLVQDPEKLKRSDKSKSHEWVDGIEIDGAGLPRRYAIHGRDKGRTKVWRKNVAARNIIHYGFFDRYATEQVHGVSPLTSALNNFRDVYENFDYALAKAKLSQIFALAMTRGVDAPALDQEIPPADDDETTEVDETAPPPREVDLSNGPVILDFMEAGEKLDLLESKTPSNELQTFSRLVLMCAFKALDLPYSWFDESHSNFHGSRGGWLVYDRSCMDKRADQIEMRRRWTVFQLQRWTLAEQPFLVLPRGMTIGDLRWKWIPKGQPWWKPSEELTADLKAIKAGIKSPQGVMAQNGLGDPDEILRQIAEFMLSAKTIGEEVLGTAMTPEFDGGPFPTEVAMPQQETT